MRIIVPIHKFASCMGYCQYIIKNHFQLGIKPEVTKAQVIGKKIHDELEEQDKLIKREEATDDELLDPDFDLDIPRETLKVSVFRKNLNNFIYVGRIDKAIRENGNIHIIDDKTSSKSYIHFFPDVLLQLSCYCEGFIKKIRNVSFNKIFLKVVQRNIKGEVMAEHEKEYDGNLRQSLIRNFNLFENIYNNTKEPEHHYNPNKCAACSYKCKFRMV